MKVVGRSRLSAEPITERLPAITPLWADFVSLPVRSVDGTCPQFLFTENETNIAKLFNVVGDGRYAKDAFHESCHRPCAGV